jgi:predicted DNA-binding antitoxin AbrB/MazE fold protein
MSTTFQAVFENGVLRPLAPLNLAEGQTVQVLIAASEMAAPQNVASILAEIAALPVEGGGDPWTSRDHDQVLYGGKPNHG